MRIEYPGDWRPKPSQDYELFLVPARAEVAADRHISFDIPDLPPHLPWMIQMGRVQKDYLADLKKSHPDLQLVDAADVKIPDSTARLVRSTWHEGKDTHADVALLIIHGSGVYILDAQSDAPHLADTRAAFDAIRASLKWK